MASAAPRTATAFAYLAFGCNTSARIAAAVATTSQALTPALLYSAWLLQRAITFFISRTETALQPYHLLSLSSVCDLNIFPCSSSAHRAIKHRSPLKALPVYIYIADPNALS